MYKYAKRKLKHKSLNIFTCKKKILNFKQTKKSHKLKRIYLTKGVKKMSGREGGKLKPLKQPKKEKKELDEVSARTKKWSFLDEF